MTSVNFYDKEQTDDLLTAKADASNVYTKSEIDAKEIGAPTESASSTGSLWARLKNSVARIVSLETADSDNVKKTGTSTVTGTLEVPTTPPTPTSVVNSAYVNDASIGVNNIAHLDGPGQQAINMSTKFNKPIVGQTNAGIRTNTGSTTAYVIAKGDITHADITAHGVFDWFHLVFGISQESAFPRLGYIKFERTLSSRRVFIAEDSDGVRYILVSGAGSAARYRLQFSGSILNPAGPVDSTLNYWDGSNTSYEITNLGNVFANVYEVTP